MDAGLDPVAKGLNAPMSCFKDGAGREWRLALNVLKIEAIREFDPDFLHDDGETYNTIARLTKDPLLFLRVLDVLTQRQQKDDGVSADDLQDALGESTLDAAYDAVIEAIINFTPTAGRRDLLRAMVKRKAEAETVGIQAASDAIKDPKAIERMRAAAAAAIEKARENDTTPSPSVIG